MPLVEQLGMEPFDFGLIGAGVLLVLVFMGVRVFLAAAVVGLFGLVALLGWEAGAGMDNPNTRD